MMPKMATHSNSSNDNSQKTALSEADYDATVHRAQFFAESAEYVVPYPPSPLCPCFVLHATNRFPHFAVLLMSSEQTLFSLQLELYSCGCQSNRVGMVW